MTALLHRVKSKMFIFAHRKARGLLDGEYGSVFKGRSLDFDDLRAYVPGDEVRDIDWKASARHGSPLIRRYVAVRQQQVLLVVDTGRNMAAESLGGEPKKDIAVMALGVLGSLALNHGDPVGLVHGDATGTQALPVKAGEANLERILRKVDDVGRHSAPSAPGEQLGFVERTFRRRMLLFVVADEGAVAETTERQLRRLRAQHEILWLTIRDADLTAPAPAADPAGRGAALRDVVGRAAVVHPVAASPKVLAAYQLARTERDAARSHMLRRAGITEGYAGSSHEVVPAIFSLLESHRRGG
ncbi:DUF58 domain-containing protein [Arthrobacter sp. G.S.26]|uniref:DUF58 domain-containing protein n=1 Tax=Arthrobacter sp. G.S.26 TaxID=3433706 RepID=UPI003D77E94C